MHPAKQETVDVTNSRFVPFKPSVVLNTNTSLCAHLFTVVGKDDGAARMSDKTFSAPPQQQPSSNNAIPFAREVSYVGDPKRVAESYQSVLEKLKKRKLHK